MEGGSDQRKLNGITELIITCTHSTRNNTTQQKKHHHDAAATPKQQEVSEKHTSRFLYQIPNNPL